MPILTTGEQIPEILASTSERKVFRLSEYADRQLVFFFFPKLHTPSSTITHQDFSAHYDQFKQLNTEIVGISRDDPDGLEQIRSDLSIPYLLISDQSEALSKFFNVLHPKKMFGKTIHRLVPSSFLIGTDNYLQAEWRDHQKKGHAQQIIQFINQSDSKHQTA